MGISMKDMAVAQAKRGALRAVIRAITTPVRWALYLLGGVVTIFADSPRWEKTASGVRSTRQEARQIVGAALWTILPSVLRNFDLPKIFILVASVIAVVLVGRRLRYLSGAASYLSIPSFWIKPGLLALMIPALAAAATPSFISLDWRIESLAVLAGGLVWCAALMVSASIAGRGRARASEVAAMLRVACGVTDQEVTDALRFKSGAWSLLPAPAIARAKINADPLAVDRVVASIMPGYELVLNGGSLAVQPVSDETQERRNLDSLSNGLVVEERATGGGTELLLSPSISPSHAEAVATYAAAHHAGAALVQWKPLERRAFITQLSPDLMAVRSRIAAQLRAYDHDLSIEQATDEQKHRTLQFSAPQLMAADRVARRKIAGELKASVAAAPELSWRTRVDDAAGTITMLERRDPLMDMLTIDGFREQFPLGDDPSRSWKSFQIAITEDSDPVPFSLFHTLAVGQTGAGKGSVIWSILSGVLPAAREGLAEIYAIDPKGAEAIAEDGSVRGMFQQVVTTPDDWAVMVSDVVAKMNSRKGQGRSLPVTREQPLIVLFIDELSALTALDTDTKRAKQVMSDLLLIASQGRSMNVLLVAAVQAPQKEMLGALRQFLAMRVALRTETTIETDLVLGSGASDFGAEAHLIPVASPGNNYRSAGIGYVRVDGIPEPQRVRFPYTDDATLDRWDQEFRTLRASGSLPPQIGTAAPAVIPADTFGQIIESAPADQDLGEMDMADFDFDFSDAAPAEQPPAPLDFGQQSPPPVIPSTTTTIFDDLFDS